METKVHSLILSSEGVDLVLERAETTGVVLRLLGEDFWIDDVGAFIEVLRSVEERPIDRSCT